MRVGERGTYVTRGGSRVAKRALRALAVRWLNPRVRLTLSRILHRELGPRAWRAERRRERMARVIASNPDLVSVDGAVVARDISVIWGPDAVREAVHEALRQAEIEHVVVPVQGGRPVIAVQSTDVARLPDALGRLPDGATWRMGIDTSLRMRWLTLDAGCRKNLHAARAVWLRRAYVAADGHDVAVEDHSEAVIQIWDVLAGGEARPDGEPHHAGTRIPRTEPVTVPYLLASEWTALAQGSPQAHALVLPHLLAVTEPIDVVYTWVDGEDEDWQQRKSEAMGLHTEVINRTADAASRFISRDELRFSLRSLELYAPWVRHVYVVTDGQRPDWLVESHPRLTVVDHSEIFRNADALPVFNSHAIESQLHHIEGLSDRYLYLNDDVFFGRPVHKETFFEANGISKFFLSPATLDVGPVSARDLPVLSAAKHNADVIAKAWGRSITTKFKHTPHTQNRVLLDEMERRFPEVFEQVSGSRIRHPDDYSIASALQHYYAYAEGRAVPAAIRYAYVDITARGAELPLTKLLRERDRDVFCLNDTFADAAGRARADAVGRWFLSSYFPVPSTFERVGDS